MTMEPDEQLFATCRTLVQQSFHNIYGSVSEVLREEFVGQLSDPFKNASYQFCEHLRPRAAVFF